MAPQKNHITLLLFGVVLFFTLQQIGVNIFHSWTGSTSGFDGEYDYEQHTTRLTKEIEELKEQNSLLRLSIDTMNRTASDNTAEDEADDEEDRDIGMESIIVDNSTTEYSFPTFPTCVDWVAQNSPSDFPEDSDTVHWAKRSDGSHELTLPKKCQLHRFTGEEARNCLSKQHLVMIGDSLSRYQFLSLVYLIEQGHYTTHFGRPMKKKKNCTRVDEYGRPSCSAGNHVLMEKNYGDWDKYHVDIGGADDGGPFFNGRLECQCVRTKNSTATLRYVSSDGIQLTFLKEQGWGGTPDLVRGWKPSGCAVNGTCRFSLEYGEELKTIAHRDFAEILEDGLTDNGNVQKYVTDVDHVVYNRGIWGDIPLKRAEVLFPRLRKWASRSCIHKTTTRGKKAINKDAFFMRENRTRTQAKKSGCKVYHVHKLTEPFAALKKNETERGNFYWDVVHFQPYVYNELNVALLNMMCGKEHLVSQEH